MSEHRTPPGAAIPRRRLLQAGLAGASVLLAACGSGAEEAPSPSSPGPRRTRTPEAVGGSVAGSAPPSPSAPSRRGSSSGGLLAYAEFNPGAITEITHDRYLWKDVEPEHLRVRFTAPQSGRVLVVINAVAHSRDRRGVHLWGLRGTGGDARYQGLVPDSGRLMMAATDASYRKTYRHIAAVDPGAEYDWTFAFSARATVIAIQCGRDPSNPDAPEGYGPAQMEVWEA